MLGLLNSASAAGDWAGTDHALMLDCFAANM